MPHTKKIALTSLTASLAIPVTDLTANEVQTSQHLYGISASLMNAQQARQNMQHSQLRIPLSQYLQQANLSGRLHHSAMVWQKILLDKQARRTFSNDPYHTLKELGISQQYIDSNYESLMILRILLSEEAQAYLQQGDLKSFFDLLRNYGIIKVSYPVLRDKIKRFLQQNSLAQQGKTSEQKTISSIEARPPTDDVQAFVVVANLAVFLNIGFAVNVAVISNVHSGLLVMTHAIATSNSSVSGGGCDLRCKYPDHLDTEEAEQFKHQLQSIERVSSLDPEFAQTTRLLLFSLAQKSPHFKQAVDEVLKFQITTFCEALLDPQTTATDNKDKQELEQLLTKLLYV